MGPLRGPSASALMVMASPVFAGAAVGTAAVRSPWGVDQRARAVFWSPAG
ncbi:hypothetical protein [Rhodococcus sp. IEGM 1305]|nr:hypothetical protein [Rhodococcus sp. IEGM 1305]MDI9949267.1 hypothetical protein [Rhodococcus sp. IEGM 1305]